MRMTKLRTIGVSTVDFPLVGQDGSGPFILKEVDGLGPPDVSVRLTRTTLERAIYQGKSVALRQLVLTVALQPQWESAQTPEQLRTTLYGLLTPKYGAYLQVQVMDGNTVKGVCQGHVSKMEPAIFAKDPTVVITIDCDYPYLLGPTALGTIPAQADAGGIRSFTVNNAGTAPAGFRMGVILRANVGTTLTLSDDSPLGQKIQIKGLFWEAGDRFMVDTRPGTRGVYQGKQGTALVSCINNLDAAVSEWLTLYSGDNKLLLNTSAFDWDPGYNFAYQPAFWGV